MTHVTGRLTAKNRDQHRNPTFGNRVWATFTTIFTETWFLPSQFDVSYSIFISALSRAFGGFWARQLGIRDRTYKQTHNAVQINTDRCRSLGFVKLRLAESQFRKKTRQVSRVPTRIDYFPFCESRITGCRRSAAPNAVVSTDDQYYQ